MKSSRILALENEIDEIEERIEKLRKHQQHIREWLLELMNEEEVRY
jgi:DNA-binding transcriptional regulator GbsR (MarR family)